MNSYLNNSTRLLAIAITSAAFVTSASAQNTWRITRPGSYKLYANLSTTNAEAILITASGVTLDLNGHSINAKNRGTGRGIVVQGAKAVTVKNGTVSGFNANVVLENSESTKVDQLSIVGDGLPPNNGPSEIGVLILNSFGSAVENNNISSVNLGVFVRGEKATGNRIMKNVITGGRTSANNLLGICYNPAPAVVEQPANPAGPRGDSIYNNQISRFNFAIAVSAGSVSNMFNDNTLASFTGAFREPQNFQAQGGTNAEFDNTAVTIPTTNL